MSDDNAELVARLARRGEEVREESLMSSPTTLTSGDWNAPIDTIQADAMTAREVIRGEFAEAKDRARAWEPRPCPPRGQDGMTPRRVVLPPTVQIAPPQHVEGDPLL